MQETQSGQSRGLLFAIFAYLLWGVAPIYFLLMSAVAPLEVVGWRVLSTVIVCIGLVALLRRWKQLRAVLRDRRTLLWLVLAGIVIFANWTIFVFAVITGHIIESALGYFLNPILTVLLGVLVLHERLRPAQWVAVAVSVVAVVVLVIGYGEFPWISIGLALAFGIYGLCKKQVGQLDPITGFTVETIAVVPLAVGILIVTSLTTGLGIVAADTSTQLAVAGFGIITAAPLLLFASAARRVSLATLGLTQYIAPVLSFLFGAFVMNESMPLERWIGFALVWVSLVILSVDIVMHHGKTVRARRRAPLTGEIPLNS
ncbi:EamA family transporter RarD [Humidisolicoccus flavus]|uniref:EamA family transporter RarD n=1 Tax=Humidisolicoccus flavus TaxID=3111414 RepID=UPI00324BD93E